MTKENLEIYQEVFPKSQLRRMKVVDEYLNTFGEMIKKKVISPNCCGLTILVDHSAHY